MDTTWKEMIEFWKIDQIEYDPMEDVRVMCLSFSLTVFLSVMMMVLLDLLFSFGLVLWIVGVGIVSVGLTWVSYWYWSMESKR